MSIWTGSSILSGSMDGSFCVAMWTIRGRLYRCSTGDFMGNSTGGPVGISTGSIQGSSTGESWSGSTGSSMGSSTGGSLSLRIILQLPLPSEVPQVDLRQLCRLISASFFTIYVAVSHVFLFYAKRYVRSQTFFLGFERTFKRLPLGYDWRLNVRFVKA